MDDSTRIGAGEPSRSRRSSAASAPLPGLRRGRLFGRFLKVVDRCEACGTELHHHRADDLPPYLVILIVGHLVGWAFSGRDRFERAASLHLALWPALTVASASALLQPVKGAVVGLQYALGMHGFGAAKAAAGSREGARAWRTRGRRASPID